MFKKFKRIVSYMLKQWQKCDYSLRNWESPMRDGEKRFIFEEKTGWSNRKIEGTFILPLWSDLVAIWAVRRAWVAISNSWTFIFFINCNLSKEGTVFIYTQKTRNQRQLFLLVCGCTDSQPTFACPARCLCRHHCTPASACWLSPDSR